MHSLKYSFKATILQSGNINAAYVEFPFSVQELFGKKGQVKIKAVFDGKVEYRGSLAKMKSDCHILGLTQEIRKKLGKSFGDEVEVELWEDLEERKVSIPEDVHQLFNSNQEAQQIFEKLSYTHQKEYIRWIEDAKKQETRDQRKEKMMRMLREGKKGI